MNTKLASLTILKAAQEGAYAIPAFNINGSDWIEAALTAAQRENSPLILASSDRLSDYLGGFRVVHSMVHAYCEAMDIRIPLVLHLDHGGSFERCAAAMDAGYSSVMIDGSRLPIEENIALTRRVADYARERGVSVEAEVGCVGGSEDGLNSGIAYADIEECVKLVQETGVDALAAALGSVHGIYRGEPCLSFERMEEIKRRISTPLVLHGASGIPAQQIRRCIDLGHAKININTECNQVWLAGLQSELEKHPDTHEPRVVMQPAKEALCAYMQSRMQEFGSSGRAKEVMKYV